MKLGAEDEDGRGKNVCYSEQPTDRLKCCGLCFDGGFAAVQTVLTSQHGFVDTVFALFICFKAVILNSFQNIALASDLTFCKIQSTVTILFKYLRS